MELTKKHNEEPTNMWEKVLWLMRLKSDVLVMKVNTTSGTNLILGTLSMLKAWWWQQHDARVVFLINRYMKTGQV